MARLRTRGAGIALVVFVVRPGRGSRPYRLGRLPAATGRAVPLCERARRELEAERGAVQERTGVLACLRARAAGWYRRRLVSGWPRPGAVGAISALHGAEEARVDADNDAVASRTRGSSDRMPATPS